VLTGLREAEKYPPENRIKSGIIPLTGRPHPRHNRIGGPPMKNLLIIALAAVVIVSLFNNARQRQRIRQLKEQVSIVKAQARESVVAAHQVEGMLTSYEKRMESLEVRASQCRGLLDMPPGVLPLPLSDPPVRNDNS
jgi:hypothetical protein